MSQRHVRDLLGLLTFVDRRPPRSGWIGIIGQRAVVVRHDTITPGTGSLAVSGVAAAPVRGAVAVPGAGALALSGKQATVV